MKKQLYSTCMNQVEGKPMNISPSFGENTAMLKKQSKEGSVLVVSPYNVPHGLQDGNTESLLLKLHLHQFWGPDAANLNVRVYS